MVKRLIVLVTLLMSTVAAFAGGQTLHGHKLPAYYYTTTGLNIRQSPSINGKKITTLPKHTELYVVELAENGFCQVKYNGMMAYVSTDYLTFSRESDVKSHVVYDGKLVRQGDGFVEFVWNLSVICYDWFDNLLGKFRCWFGFILMVIGWLILKGRSENLMEEGENGIIKIGVFMFEVVLPLIIDAHKYNLYNHNNTGGWIGLVCLLIAFGYVLLAHPDGSGFRGIVAAFLSCLLIYFGLLLSLVGVTQYIISGLIVLGIIIGGFKGVASGDSSSTTYGDTPPSRDGNRWLPGEYGSDDKGEYEDDNTFVKNNGDTYYRHSDGNWHSWRE